MQTAVGPGDTPEWKTKITGMNPFQRSCFAVDLGVTDRTIKNWIDGKCNPSDATIERIKAQFRKAKK